MADGDRSPAGLRDAALLELLYDCGLSLLRDNRLAGPTVGTLERGGSRGELGSANIDIQR